MGLPHQKTHSYSRRANRRDGTDSAVSRATQAGQDEGASAFTPLSTPVWALPHCSQGFSEPTNTRPRWGLMPSLGNSARGRAQRWRSRHTGPQSIQTGLRVLGAWAKGPCRSCCCSPCSSCCPLCCCRLPRRRPRQRRCHCAAAAATAAPPHTPGAPQPPPRQPTPPRVPQRRQVPPRAGPRRLAVPEGAIFCSGVAPDGANRRANRPSKFPGWPERIFRANCFIDFFNPRSKLCFDRTVLLHGLRGRFCWTV